VAVLAIPTPQTVANFNLPRAARRDVLPLARACYGPTKAPSIWYLNYR